MKGYGYGIWIVYDEAFFPEIKHTGHFTVACFMEKEDALNLYVEIMDKIGNEVTIAVNKNYEIYGKNMYESDSNNICSWGYNGTSSKWPMLKTVCKKYNCNFSHQIHTSIQYAKNTNQLRPNYLEKDMIVTGCIHLVNICSAESKDWHVLL